MADREERAHGTCADISTAVTRTTEKDEDASDKVDNERAKKQKPKLEHPGNKWTRRLWNFIGNRMENQRKDCSKPDKW